MSYCGSHTLQTDGKDAFCIKCGFVLKNHEQLKQVLGEKEFDKEFLMDTDNGSGALWMFRRWKDETGKEWLSIAKTSDVKKFITKFGTPDKRAEGK